MSDMMFGGGPGGPGGPPPGAGGPPPGLMEMLAAAQGGGGPGMGPGGPDMGPGGPDMGAGGPGQGTGPGGPQGDPISLLRQAIDAITQYLSVEKDDIDVHAGTKVLAGLQAILAKNQKDMESATGVTPASRYLKKAVGG